MAVDSTVEETVLETDHHYHNISQHHKKWFI